ncbi:MAG TPA: hypothetical protein VFH56_06135, partial [Acidimicrobiales bacterium]|nr:hypothetical protein [Acidimicrobiales bacterium]
CRLSSVVEVGERRLDRWPRAVEEGSLIDRHAWLSARRYSRAGPRDSWMAGQLDGGLDEQLRANAEFSIAAHHSQHDE